MTRQNHASLSTFGATDLLVSRTDKRGVIQSANANFVRVSAIPWENLRHAPHKVVRHKDMPKGVFFTMWEHIQRNEPFGAYIKNQAGDGTHYWVFATVTPLDDGYMSVRIKASGEAYEAAGDLYQARLAAETAGENDPEASAQALEAEVQALGYHSYKAFMTKALMAQVDQRNKDRGITDSTSLAHLRAAIGLWDGIFNEVHATIAAFKRFERLPANMRIQAAHLSREGIPLGVIASNFSALSDQIEALTNAFRISGSDLEGKLLDGMFLTCVKYVQNDVLADTSETLDTLHADDLDHELEIMKRQSDHYDVEIQNALAAILQQITKFATMFTSIKTLHSGIAVTKVMADIEVAKLGVGQASSLSAIVHELSDFLTSERQRLHRMMSDVDMVGMEVKRALSVMSDPHALQSGPSRDAHVA